MVAGNAREDSIVWERILRKCKGGRGGGCSKEEGNRNYEKRGEGEGVERDALGREFGVGSLSQTERE